MSAPDAEAIKGLKSAIAEGRNWYLSLLEAVRLWASSEEEYEGRHYQYLVDNEAFDWLVLTERLCEELDGLVPEKERLDLLFFGIQPVELSIDEFKNLVGVSKYRGHLNYFYGILVERFLLLSVMEEIRKKKRALGLNNDSGVVDEAHRSIYGATQSALLKLFRSERRYPHFRSIRLSELNEFTYWLFKYRMKTCDKACAASDTNKALTKLRELLNLKARSPYPSAVEG